MKSKGLIFLAGFLFIILALSLISAALCKGSDGYYHDCSDFYGYRYSDYYESFKEGYKYGYYNGYYDGYKKGYYNGYYKGFYDGYESKPVYKQKLIPTKVYVKKYSPKIYLSDEYYYKSKKKVYYNSKKQVYYDSERYMKPCCDWD